jgi:uncharacterized protein YcbK (DUF882 family)
MAVAYQGERRLQLFNSHTSEKFSGPYWSKGRYLGDALADINHLLRDHRDGTTIPIDRDLLDLLNSLSFDIRASDGYRVISGYRSPKTNATLIAEGHDVAQRSYHMKGMAIDIAVPGRKLAALRDAARSRKRGGVALYSNPGFVHVDVGPVRYW